MLGPRGPRHRNVGSRKRPCVRVHEGEATVRRCRQALNGWELSQRRVAELRKFDSCSVSLGLRVDSPASI